MYITKEYDSPYTKDKTVRTISCFVLWDIYSFILLTTRSVEHEH